eukprot:CAMPEP_0183395692 /NCGR_PEP_ID=MMETSP0370-20130417/9500_1 /TAXON_ID=268820 /ORGANISM="Peridinium aciculiferum, Strain PAER-2" /LENGTH=560 /DNA_ID=CAMNT_0025576357 /DNA_START=71 /DNA_END=1753 /DNA_ORIENTATION=-
MSLASMGSDRDAVPWQTTDPSQALREEMAMRCLTTGKVDRASLDAIRERYIHHLGQHRLASAGYVPNLVPILRWNAHSATSSRQLSCVPSPQSEGGGSACVGAKSSALKLHAKDSECTSSSTKGGMFRPGSLRSSMINVSAAALGAGALALPRAIYYSGIVLGPLFMVVLAILSIISIKVIVQLVEVSGKDSYEEIANAAFGPWFALLVEANIILFCFGTAVAYMITVGQITQQVMESLMGPVHEAVGLAAFLSPNVVLTLVTVFVLLPLSLLDSINDLRFASLAGVSCILYLIVVVFYVFSGGLVSASLTDESHHFDGWQPKGGITGCFKMLSLAIFAFCCQPNVPAVYMELERKSFRRMEIVSVGAMVLCLIVYLMMGITGFLAFGEQTAGNVLVNLQPFLCEFDWMVASGFACMAFAVTMAFPLNIFPIRFAVETAIFFKWPHLNTRAVRTVLAIIAVATCLVVAILLPEINLIFELIGATTGSFVCFIGPGLMLCRLVPGRTFSGPKLNGVLLVVVGCIFLSLGTYSSVLDVVSQLSNKAPASSPTCPVLAKGKSG